MLFENREGRKKGGDYNPILFKKYITEKITYSSKKFVFKEALILSTDLALCLQITWDIVPENLNNARKTNEWIGVKLKQQQRRQWLRRRCAEWSGLEVMSDLEELVWVVRSQRVLGEQRSTRPMFRVALLGASESHQVYIVYKLSI